MGRFKSRVVKSWVKCIYNVVPAWFQTEFRPSTWREREFGRGRICICWQPRFGRGRICWQPSKLNPADNRRRILRDVIAGCMHDSFYDVQVCGVRLRIFSSFSAREWACRAR